LFVFLLFYKSIEGDIVMSELKESLFSKKVHAGNRTYFFDVKESVDGDKYIVMSESKKISENNFEHHKIMIFQEDLDKFANGLTEAIRFIQGTVK